MKRMMMILGALAAFQAAAITATKEYVDRRDNEISTNRYTKAETDARIVELAPVPGNYETVSNRAMTALQQHQDISGKADATNVYTKAQTDARIVELAPVPDVQGAIGAFAATGTVHQAEAASYATDADRANVATEAQVANRLGDSETGDLRTAAQIFSALDSKVTTNDVCNIVTNDTITVSGPWRPLDFTSTMTMGSVVYDEAWLGGWGVEVNDSATTADTYPATPIPNLGTNSYYLAFDAPVVGGDMRTFHVERTHEVKNKLGFARLTDIPSTNGLATKVYVDEAIAAAGGGGEWVETNVTATLRFVTGYEHVTLPSGGILTADTNDWPNGAALMVDLVPGGTYTVSGITMLGYQTWPTNRAEMVVFRSGTNMFANVILTY